MAADVQTMDALQDDDSGNPPTPDLGVDDMGVVQPDMELDQGTPDVGPGLPASKAGPFDALWLFEAPDGLMDSDGTHDLAVNEGFTEMSEDAPEGSNVLRLESTQVAAPPSADTVGEEWQRTLYAGGWFKEAVAQGTASLMGSYRNSSVGWAIAALPDSPGIVCSWRAPEEVNDISTPPLPNPPPRGSWNHYVCEIELFVQNGQDMARGRIWINGQPAEWSAEEEIVTGGRFRIGSDSASGGFGFVGSADEVFIATDLPDGAVRKLWACGASGELCRCDASNLAAYSDCGRASDCTTLAACR